MWIGASACPTRVGAGWIVSETPPPLLVDFGGTAPMAWRLEIATGAPTRHWRRRPCPDRQSYEDRATPRGGYFVWMAISVQRAVDHIHCLARGSAL